MNTKLRGKLSVNTSKNQEVEKKTKVKRAKAGQERACHKDTSILA